MTTLTFEDFPPGHFGTFGPRHVTREEILAFAAEFDPQPMHLDEAAANASMLKGLSGSGWHLCSIMMRMMFDGFIGRTASLGSPGVNEMRWLAPLRPGDDLTLDVEVAEAQDFEEPSRNRHRDLQGHDPQRGRHGAVRDGIADHRAPARRGGERSSDAFLRGHRDRRAARVWLVHLHRRATSRNLPRSSIRSAFTSTRRKAANPCSAGWPHRAGMSARSA